MASSVRVISTTHASQHHMDRLDAARALLGVSPSPQTSDPTTTSNHGTSRLSASNVSFVVSSPNSSKARCQPTAQHSQETPLLAVTTMSPSSSGATRNRVVSFEQQIHRFELAPPARITSTCSTGLDALAALASREQASWELQQQKKQQTQTTPTFLMVRAPTTASSWSSSSDEDDSEAMPPPPPRAGGRRRSVSNPEGMEKWAPPSTFMRRHFVLPASILEEELAQANAAMEAHERHNQQKLGSIEEGQEPQQQQLQQKPASRKPAPVSGLLSQEEQANLSPEELLKRARSRLLEDLSEGSLNGEKGVLTLPHSLSKYKEVYNKNGRIGIYTPAERAAIIARFNSKRSRRVWNKKIRYNCRKNLADRRMRVKGRFVKRSTEQQARAEAATVPSAAAELLESSEQEADEDMPDVTDPEAGFCPTEDQPYRRTRRHTIT